MTIVKRHKRRTKKGRTSVKRHRRKVKKRRSDLETLEKIAQRKGITLGEQISYMKKQGTVDPRWEPDTPFEEWSKKKVEDPLRFGTIDESDFVISSGREAAVLQVDGDSLWIEFEDTGEKKKVDIIDVSKI